MSSSILAIGGLLLGLIVPAGYYVVTRDPSLPSNLAAELFGLGLSLAAVYLLVERRLTEERRGRLREVEGVVLDGVLAHATGSVRRIAMFAGVDALRPRPGEDDSQMIRATEQFAKNSGRKSIKLPEPLPETPEEFSRGLDGVITGAFDLQRAYPFVFQEYPDVARLMIQLQTGIMALKSGLWWWKEAGYSRRGVEEQRVEELLRTFVGSCDDLAETGSVHLNRIRDGRRST